MPAQTITASLQGRATDSSGAVVVGAAVRAVNTQTGISSETLSNSSGEYLFPALSTGSYRIEATAPGFKRFVRSGVLLEVNQNARVDLTLEVGNVSEQVTVNAEAPLVDTRQVQIGGTVDEARVQTLPLNGRNVYDLVAILPGVTGVRTPEVLDSGGTQMNVNGSRGRSSTFLLDGAFNNDTWRNQGNAAPNPDAVEQFRLITSNFNAEFGRSPGAVVNVVTKSGTNQLHGTAYEYLRNSALNARSFFQPIVNPIRQNQFGATLGGPVRRDRTFFFGSWQSLRIRALAFTNNGLTPTAAERRGDFSSAPVNQRPRDPLTNQPFPNGIIPADRLDPVAQRILSDFVPTPNTPDGRLEVQASRRTDEDQWLGKVDHQLATAHRLSGTWFHSRSNLFDPFTAGTQIPGWGEVDSQFIQRNVVANHDWIASPTALNSLRFSVTSNESALVAASQKSWPDFGSRVVVASDPPRLPQMFITGRWQMGTFGEGTATRRSYGLQDTLTLVRGGHSVKLGAWLLFHRYLEQNNWLGAGQIRFNGAFTGNVLADFLLGRSNSFRQNSGTDVGNTGRNYHFYVQDDWRVSRKLTLNLGLRHELNPPYVPDGGRTTTFRFNQQSTVVPLAPRGLLFPGDEGVPSGTSPVDRTDLAPRVGLAYDVFGNGRTALRAGWGMFYAAPTSNMLPGGPPFILDVTVFGTPNLVEPYANVPGGNPFPYNYDPANPRFTPPITMTSPVFPPFRTPYVQHYSLTVEQQLTGSLALTAAYVGNASRKLLTRRDANAPIFGPGATAGNVNQRRPYLPGTFAAIQEQGTGSNANYNSLQVTLNRRFARGFSVLGAYTWGKSIDEGSDDVGAAPTLQDNNRRFLERGPSAHDVRHTLAVSWVSEVPAWRGLGVVSRHVLGNWQLTGIARFETGSPFTVTSGQDNNLDGNTTDRPNVVGEWRIARDRSRDQALSQWLNRSAFAPAPNGQVGNLGRNTFYGPGSAVWNANIAKVIPLGERVRLQFRSEFFNLFNRANFANPNSTLNSPNFGRILGADAGRVIQFALRLQF